MAIDPDRQRLALAFKFSSRLYVFDAQARLERTIAGLRDVRLDFNVGQSTKRPFSFVRTPETRPSYVSVTADRTLIYALFSGRSIGEFGAAHIDGDELHVFHWTGEPVGRWKLAQAVGQIAVDPASGRLFALKGSPSPAILELDTTPIHTPTSPAAGVHVQPNASIARASAARVTTLDCRHARTLQPAGVLQSIRSEPPARRAFRDLR
jgi:hypothetical protein